MLAQGPKPLLKIVSLAVFCCMGLFAVIEPAAQAAQALESLQTIRQAAAAFARRQAERRLPGARIEVKAPAIDSRLRLAACASPLAAGGVSGAAQVGNTVVSVQCPSPRWRLYVPVRVDAYLEVLVAAQTLRRGTHLGAEDLGHALRNAADLPYGYFTRLAAVEGQVLTRNLSPGMVLTPQVLRPPLLVKRGQIVTLTAGSGGLLVSTQGEALQSGAQGALVRVRNLQSNRIVQGRVSGTGIVHVGG